MLYILCSKNLFLLLATHILRLQNRIPVVRVGGAAVLYVAQVVVELRAFGAGLAVGCDDV